MWVRSVHSVGIVFVTYFFLSGYCYGVIIMFLKLSFQSFVKLGLYANVFLLANTLYRVYIYVYNTPFPLF